MISEDINGSRERSAVEVHMSSGRRFIYTSLSSPSSSEIDEEDYMILTASSLSLDLSETSSQDELFKEIEGGSSASPLMQMYLSESSGTSDTMNGSGHGSLSSSVCYELLQRVGAGSSDMSCCFRDADVSSSSHENDEILSQELHYSYRRLSCVVQNSDDSRYLMDQVSSSSIEDVEISTVDNLGVQFYNSSKSSNSDKDSSDCNMKDKLVKSNLCYHKINRKDLIYSWVLQGYYNLSNELVLSSSESSGSYKTAESDLEDLQFQDAFAYFSKPFELEGKSSKQRSSQMERDGYIVPARQSKVTFAPPESLVTVHHFERTAEELEDDVYFQALKADKIRFNMRISEFKKVIDPFLREEFRYFIILRNDYFLSESRKMNMAS